MLRYFCLYMVNCSTNQLGLVTNSAYYTSRLHKPTSQLQANLAQHRSQLSPEVWSRDKIIEKSNLSVSTRKQFIIFRIAATTHSLITEIAASFGWTKTFLCDLAYFRSAIVIVYKCLMQHNIDYQVNMFYMKNIIYVVWVRFQVGRVGLSWVGWWAMSTGYHFWHHWHDTICLAS